MAETIHLPARAQPETAAAGGVSLHHRLPAFHQHAAGGKIGTGDFAGQLADRQIRGIDQGGQCLANLGHIMGRDIGCHPHRNTGGPIGEQIGESGRHNHGFIFRTVVSRAEINRILVKSFHQQGSDLGQAGLGIAHRSRVIAVDIAEITLPVHQRIANGKILGQTHQSVINRLIAMRMIFTDHIPDHPGAFLKSLTRVQLQLAHGE